MNLLVGLCDVHIPRSSFILVASFIFLVSEYVTFALKQRKTKYVIIL